MRSRKGFTLTELLAVIALLAVLALLVVPNVIFSIKDSKKNAFITEAKTVLQESADKYIKERTEGNKINLVSNEIEGGSELSLSNGKKLKYTVRLDKNGNITSFKLFNEEFCLIGTGDKLDNLSPDDIIDLINEKGTSECVSSSSYENGEKLTLNLKIKTGDNPVTTMHDPETIYLKFNDGWYDSDKNNANRLDDSNKVTIPTKKGYYFKGFFLKNNENDNVVDCNGVINADSTGMTTSGTQIFTAGVSNEAYSSFARKFYVIKYDGNKATSGSMQNNAYYYGTKYRLTKNKYTRTGYTFNGWMFNGNHYTDNQELPEINEENENQNPEFKFVQDSSCNAGSTNTKNFVAEWIANRYKVTLVSKWNGRNATIARDEITVTYDGKYTDLPTPSIKGFRFDGWYTDNTFKTKVNNTDTVKITSDTTFYAKYTVLKYYVTYDANGGSDAPDEQSFDPGTSITLTNNKPVKTNYFFLGWAASPDATTPSYYSNQTYAFADDMILYAVWTKKLYLYKEGNEYIENTGGWEFARIEKNGTGEKQSSCLFLGHAVIGCTASQFSTVSEIPPGKYKVHLRYNKAVTVTGYWGYSYIQFGTSYRVSICDNTVGVHEEIFDVDLANWSKFIFGNFDSDEFIYEIYLTVEEKSDNRQYIYYDLQGGEIKYTNEPLITDIERQSFIKGKSVILNPRTPLKDGYTFLGWNTNRNATTATYSPNTVYTFSGDTTLYAIWKKN